MSIIQGKAGANSVLYSNGFKTYDGLVNYGFKQHFRVNHGENHLLIQFQRQKETPILYHTRKTNRRRDCGKHKRYLELCRRNSGVGKSRFAVKT